MENYFLVFHRIFRNQERKVPCRVSSVGLSLSQGWGNFFARGPHSVVEFVCGLHYSE